MTALDIGGTGSVLIIWSALVVVIGTALFLYSIVVTLRGRRSRKRRRRPALPRPRQPASARPGFPLPSGPTAGGMPVDRHLGAPRQRALPDRGRRPLALPARPTPAAPPPGSRAPMPPGLPSGPLVGTGYGAAPASYASTADYSVFGATTALPAAPSPPYEPPSYEAPSYEAPSYEAPSYEAPSYEGSSYEAPSYEVPAISAGPAIETAPSYPQSAPPAYPQSAPPSYPQSGPPAYPAAPVEPARKEARSGRRQAAECAQLRAECEAMREAATAAQAKAAQAATEAEAAHAEYVTAQRAADEARRAYEAVTREANQVSSQIAALEPAATDEQLQAATSHAAFAAYRRGDISSEQLREVFKRADGWTPAHDQLSRRATELRAEETDRQRIREAALQAEDVAAEKARITAISARALDDEARNAVIDARGRCAAADACEQRLRRRR